MGSLRTEPACYEARMRGISGVLLGCFIVACAPAQPPPEPASAEAETPPSAGEAASPAASEEPKRERFSEIGNKAPAVGDLAPNFELPDQDGNPVSLAAALDAGPVVLVFYRGEW